MPFETTKTAGDDLESHCLKCKCVTNHTIIAMTGTIVAKVQCNSCAGRHNYRPPTPEKKRTPTTLRRRDGLVIASSKRATKSKTTGRKKTTGKSVNFETLLRGRNASLATPYTISANLQADDLLNHSLFGLGVVIETILPNKAEVMFQEHGTKILICIPR